MSDDIREFQQRQEAQRAARELERANAAANPSSGPRGVLRSREESEDDDGPPPVPSGAFRLEELYTPLPGLDRDMMSINTNTIFTLEDGRAYKKHKGLTAEADTEAEKFLKVIELLLYHGQVNAHRITLMYSRAIQSSKCS